MVSSEMPAISAHGVRNRLCQTIPISTNTYSVGSVAVKLRKKLGDPLIDFPLKIALYEADSSGNPSVFVTEALKTASAISETGWQFFSLESGTLPTPSSRKLSFVLWQDGGDEDNYVAWFYGTSSMEDGSVALYSSDGGTHWQEYDGVSMAIKVLSPFSAFEHAYDTSPDSYISSSPGLPSSLALSGTEYLSSGTMDGCKMDGDKVVIDNSKLMASFVIDCSGSMGWNDRAKKKILFAKEAVSRLQTKYPGQLLIDIIKMGATDVGSSSFEGRQPYAAVKLDIQNPTRTTLNSDGSTPVPGDVVVAAGFANLTASHTYVVSSVKAGPVVLIDGEGAPDPSTGINTPFNMESVGESASSALFSIQDAGPGSEKGSGTPSTVVEVPSSGTTQVRHPISSATPLRTSRLSHAAVSGDTVIRPEESSFFSVGSFIDVVDANGVSTMHKVTAAATGSLTIDPKLDRDFGTGSSAAGGFVQQSSSVTSFVVGGYQFLELLVKDAAATTPVTFYLQTSKGGSLEWDFIPIIEWKQMLMTFADQSLLIEVYAYDSDGNPITENAEINMYVDAKPSWSSTLAVQTFTLSPPIHLAAGSDSIVLPSVTNLSLGYLLELKDDDHDKVSYGNEIQEIDDVTKRVTFSPPVYEELWVSTVVVTPPPTAEKSQEEIGMTVTAVDVTPMVAGRKISERLREPTDPPQVSPSQSNYDYYNDDESRWLFQTFEIPSIRQAGSHAGTAAARILPFTDDKLSTNAEKDADIASSCNPQSTLSDQERAELESLENAYENIQADPSAVVVDGGDPSSSSSSENQVVGDDYVVAPFSFVPGGTAVMTTTTQAMQVYDLGRSNYGFDINAVQIGTETGGVLAKEYTLYPVLVMKDVYGNMLSRFVLESQLAYFVSPVQTFSEVDKTVTIGPCSCLPDEGDCAEFNISLPGTYASSGDDVTLSYTIYDHSSYMTTGTMRVRIFDLDRSREIAATSPDSVFPDVYSLFNCEPWKSCPTCDSVDSASPDQYIWTDFKRSDSESAYWVDSQPGVEATYLDGYTEGGIDVPIVNGHAEIVIPATWIVCRLNIVAEVKSTADATMSCVRSDLACFINPLKLSLDAADAAMSGLDQPAVDLRACATYLGQPVSDGSEISAAGSQHDRWIAGDSAKVDPSSDLGKQMTVLADTLTKTNPLMGDQVRSMLASPSSWPATPVIPSTGGTISGCATGFKLGPHDLVLMHESPRPEDEGSMIGDSEVVSCSMDYVSPVNGKSYSAVARHKIEWKSSAEDLAKNEYAMRVTTWKNGRMLTGFPSLYADGWDYVVMIADIPASHNGAYKLFDDPNIVDCLLGRNTPQKIGTSVSFGGNAGTSGQSVSGMLSNIFGADNSTNPNMIRPVDPDTGVVLGDDSDDDDRFVGWAAAKMAHAMPVPPATSNPDPNTCVWPTCETINIGCYAKYSRTGNNPVYLWGCASDDYSGCDIPGLSGESIKYKPRISWVEPLAGSVGMNGRIPSSTNPIDIPRDGVTPIEIAADVTFSGYPIPLVAEQRKAVGKDGKPVGFPTVNFDVYYVRKAKDSQGNVISESEVRDSTLTLTSHDVQVSVCRTTVTASHYHACSVDGYGTGSTTKTFAANSVTEITNHTHSILEHVVAAAADSAGADHTHSVKSVAITTLNPVTNQQDDICVKATTTYDASSEYVSRVGTFTSCTDIEGAANEQWFLGLSVPNCSYVCNDVTKSDHGFTVSAALTHYVGGTQVDVPDGTRVQIQTKAYRTPYESDSGVTNFYFEDNDRPYAVIEFTARCNIGGKQLQDVKNVMLISALKWFPETKALLKEPTDDAIYVDDALDQISQVKGVSPISDAAYMAAGRMYAYQVQNPSWESSNKILFLLTDGDENSNKKTASQVVTKMNQLSGDGKSPVVCFLFGNPHPADKMTAALMCDPTSGYVYSVPFKYPDAQISYGVQTAMSGASDAFNSGSYVNKVDLAGNNLYKNAAVSVSVPSGGQLSFSAGFSQDGESYGLWTSAVTLTGSGIVVLPQTISRYMQYRMVLKGSPDFESPKLASITAGYVQASNDIVFFTPIYPDLGDDDYVSEVTISHEGTIPEHSTIQYGVCHFDSDDPADYSSVPYPAATPHRRSFLLTRFNETAVSDDGVKYSLVNGSWPSFASVDVYRLEPGMTQGVPVNASEYSLNPAAGTITMLSIQPPGTIIIASIAVDPLIRILCQITNYSEDIVKLDHIGVAYNVTQRVPRLSDGTIMRQPLDMTFELSSSSSSESSTSGGA